MPVSIAFPDSKERRVVPTDLVGTGATRMTCAQVARRLGMIGTAYHFSAPAGAYCGEPRGNAQILADTAKSDDRQRLLSRWRNSKAAPVSRLSAQGFPRMPSNGFARGARRRLNPIDGPTTQENGEYRRGGLRRPGYRLVEARRPETTRPRFSSPIEVSRGEASSPVLGTPEPSKRGSQKTGAGRIRRLIILSGCGNGIGLKKETENRVRTADPVRVRRP